MAYKQQFGRANVESAQINSLTNNTPADPKPPTRNDLNKTLYQANKTIQDVKANGLGTLKPAETLYNPNLSATTNATTLFRPRGAEAYKNAILSPNKDIAEFPQGVPASFSKGKGGTPYLNSRFNVNPPRKSNIANSAEEEQLLDVRTARIGRSQADVNQYNKVQQANYRNQVNYRNDVKTPRYDEYRGDRSIYNDLISGQITSRENKVTPNKPLSTTWLPGTTQAANAATYDQKPGNLGYNLDGRTLAQIDKAKDDAVAKTMIGLHPDQVRPAEKAAKRSSKVAGTLEAAFKTGSESMMNKAITAADQTLKTDKYFGRSGNEAKKNEKSLPVKNQVTNQHYEMIENYKKASNSASRAQDTSDQLTWTGQDFAKDKADGKYSLNSNSTSSTPVNSNNLFRNERFATDITSGEKRFKL